LPDGKPWRGLPDSDQDLRTEPQDEIGTISDLIAYPNKAFDNMVDAARTTGLVVSAYGRRLAHAGVRRPDFPAHHVLVTEQGAKSAWVLRC